MIPTAFLGLKCSTPTGFSPHVPPTTHTVLGWGFASLSAFSMLKHKDAAVRGPLANVLLCLCRYCWHLAFRWKGGVPGVDGGVGGFCEGFPTSRSSLLGIWPAPPFI